MKASSFKTGVAVLAAIGTWAAAASAGIGDPGQDHVYSVPGVVHTTYLATVFQCTSTEPTGVGGQSVTVEVFDASGLLAGATQASLGGGQTVLFTTGNVASLQPNVQMGVTGPLQGSARIMGSKKMVCAAYVMSPGSVPGYMNSLPMVAKLKQKGQ